jgi:hypothetical protein
MTEAERAAVHALEDKGVVRMLTPSEREKVATHANGVINSPLTLLTQTAPLPPPALTAAIPPGMRLSRMTACQQR